MKLPWLRLSTLLIASSACAIDNNGNQQSDVWEMVFGATGLTAAGDADGDGYGNSAESAAGTNPRSGLDFPKVRLELNNGALALHWTGLAGKRYTADMSPTLGGATWSPMPGSVTGNGGDAMWPLAPGTATAFYRVNVADNDSDGDGVNDWEEQSVGFDPTRNRTDRRSQLDLARITSGLTAANVITVAVYDDTCTEGWPDPAVVVLRRTGGLQPLNVQVNFTGTAVRGTDYDPGFTGNSVAFGPGQREAFVQISALTDANDAEGAETVTLTAVAAAGYTVGSTPSGTINVLNHAANGGPSAKEAARFLIQAAFGPDQDASNDADQIPENVEEVMQMGIANWLNDQFTRPVGTLQPFVQWAKSQPGSAEIYNDTKQDAWWGRAMGLPKLRPDSATNQLPDPLRQRVAFALSQIFVISDRMEDLAVDPEGMAAYYDVLLTHAFGNYRDLLLNVSLQPCMGMYLSHLGNQKPDPVARVFPDENYAREIMQLFSIGLWMLNPDGSRQTNAQGQPIPTYNNSNITEFARVFTGLAFGGTNVNFGLYPRDFRVPMKGWDAEHDCDPKTLLLGATLPARTPSAGNTGTATMADVNGAIDNLFNHPNVGPFIGRLLIQRLVTSNPSAGYISRVAAAFANNGQGVRGDMKAVVKAILLDQEARNPAMLSDNTFGKLREPFLKCVYMARAFNAASQEGWYYLDAFTLDHVEEPLKSPSVFNYYLPTYSPPGELAQNGLVAPEFQIINASSGVQAPNYFRQAITGGMHRWGVARPERNVKLNLTQEMLMNIPAGSVGNPDPNVQSLDPDPLLRRLDLALTGGRLEPRSFQIIREALARITAGSGYDWPNRRLNLAIYLVICSPEFSVQR